MKQSLLFFLLVILLSTFSFGQSTPGSNPKNTKEFSFDAAFVQTPVLSKKAYGVNFNLEYFFTKRIATGIYFLYAQKRIADTFAYSIKKPIIQFYEAGWITQYDLLQTDRLRININLVNGFSQARLGDNAIKEKRLKNAPKEIASNFFYSLEPGSSISYRLTSTHHNADLWLTAATNYRFAFGNTRYALPKDFSGYTAGIGVSLRGFDHN